MTDNQLSQSSSINTIFGCLGTKPKFILHENINFNIALLHGQNFWQIRAATHATGTSQVPVHLEPRGRVFCCSWGTRVPIGHIHLSQIPKNETSTCLHDPATRVPRPAKTYLVKQNVDKLSVCTSRCFLHFAPSIPLVLTQLQSMGAQLLLSVTFGSLLFNFSLTEPLASILVDHDLDITAHVRLMGKPINRFIFHSLTAQGLATFRFGVSHQSSELLYTDLMQ